MNGATISSKTFKSSLSFTDMTRTYRTLSPRDLARAIGVSESSVKRWGDDGRITVSRTAGGHRRITLFEAVRFIRELRLPVVQPDILGLWELEGAEPRPPGSEASLHQFLAEGRGTEAQQLILSLYLDGESIAEICDGPLRRAIETIGTLWREADDGILVEHRAMDLCIRAVERLRSLLDEPPDEAPCALGGGIAGDPSTLPSLMVATVLTGAGYRTVNLGPNTPAKTFEAAIEAHAPQLVWISSNHMEGADWNALAGPVVEATRARHIRLIAGGSALERVSLAPGVQRFDGLRELARLAPALGTGQRPSGG